MSAHRCLSAWPALFLILAFIQPTRPTAYGNDTPAAGQDPASGDPSVTQEQADSDAQSEEDGRVDLREAERRIIERANRFRKKQGRSRLHRQPDLVEASRTFARFMAEENKYGHRADGRSPAERARAAGYAYCLIRENIGYRLDTGETTAQGLAETFAGGWIDSPEHRENLLSRHVTQIGVGVATTGGDKFYAVQLLGRPKEQSIRLEVRNPTESSVTLAIESAGGADTIQLPPHTLATVRRCLPTRLAVCEVDSGDCGDEIPDRGDGDSESEAPEAAETPPAEIDTSGTFRVERRDGDFVLTRDETRSAVDTSPPADASRQNETGQSR